MVRALEKRPVPSEELEQAIGRLIHKLRTMGEREVPSRLVGELVMQELHELDEVAYVRFASVYREFSDVQEFMDTLRQLTTSNVRSGGSNVIPLGDAAPLAQNASPGTRKVRRARQLGFNDPEKS